MMELSIVIPAYNEEDNVAAAVENVDAAARRTGLEYEIVVVDDGSRDRTGEIAGGLATQNPHLRLVQHFPNRGYGGALKAGFAAATGAWIAFFPADNQFDFREIVRLLEFRAVADVICGYRAERQDPLIRRLNAFGWNTVVRLLFGTLARDVDCGFKLLRRDVLDHVTLVSDGAMIDTELLAGAKARGYRLIDVPVTHLPRRVGQATGARPAVIVGAFVDLAHFRARLTRELHDERAAQAHARRAHSIG